MLIRETVRRGQGQSNFCREPEKKFDDHSEVSEEESRRNRHHHLSEQYTRHVQTRIAELNKALSKAADVLEVEE